MAGVGMHPFGRFEGSTTTDLGVVAVCNALAEAGIGRGGFQAAFCATAYGGVASGHKVLGRLGMTGMPIVNVEAGCASGGAALALASNAIEAGQIETALVFGVEKMPRGIIRSSFFEPWQEASGLASTPSYFALRAQRLMRTSGVTKDHLAAVVVKNRRHGSKNPDAMFRSEVDAASVLSSRVVCEPLHLWMLCSPNEGAAAVVLTAARTKPPVGDPQVRLAAAVLRSHLPGAVLSESTPMSGLTADDVPAPTTLAATVAYERAGVGPENLNVVECQDTDAAPRAALLRGARALRGRRFGGVDRRGRDRLGRPASCEPERRAALQGRTARSFCARSGRGARPPARGPRRCAAGAGCARRHVAHRRPGGERLSRDPDPLSWPINRLVRHRAEPYFER